MAAENLAKLSSLLMSSQVVIVVITVIVDISVFTTFIFCVFDSFMV